MESFNEAVPEDILIEIMLRMPLKSLLKCLSVSKKWESIIRGKDFQDLYLRRSITRPRLLFAFSRDCSHLSADVFHSVYQEEKPLLSSGQQQMHLSSPMYAMMSAPIRGLVCLQSETNAVLCNPGTRTFRTLPEFKPPERYLFRSLFLGYDDVTDVFKVLMSDSVRRHGVTEMQHGVFTVGSGETSWRPIVCEQRYAPFTNALCIGGVLYYAAWSREDEPKRREFFWLSKSKTIVVSFNVRSEEFTVTELPVGVKAHYGVNLVNYNGKVAYVNFSASDYGKHQFLVRNESTGEWSVESVVIPRWRETVGDMFFKFQGTIGTGVLVFSNTSLLDGSHLVLYYDPVTENLRKFKIEGVDGGPFQCAQTFVNHVDSLVLLTQGTNSI